MAKTLSEAMGANYYKLDNIRSERFNSTYKKQQKGKVCINY